MRHTLQHWIVAQAAVSAVKFRAAVVFDGYDGFISVSSDGVIGQTNKPSEQQNVDDDKRLESFISALLDGGFVFISLPSLPDIKQMVFGVDDDVIIHMNKLRKATTVEIEMERGRLLPNDPQRMATPSPDRRSSLGDNNDDYYLDESPEGRTPEDDYFDESPEGRTPEDSPTIPRFPDPANPRVALTSSSSVTPIPFPLTQLQQPPGPPQAQPPQAQPPHAP